MRFLQEPAGVVSSFVPAPPACRPVCSRPTARHAGWICSIQMLSAQKLRKSCLHLLVGRLVSASMHPFQAAELGVDFSFQRVLRPPVPQGGDADRGIGARSWRGRRGSAGWVSNRWRAIWASWKTCCWPSGCRLSACERSMRWLPDTCGPGSPTGGAAFSCSNCGPRLDGMRVSWSSDPTASRP